MKELRTLREEAREFRYSDFIRRLPELQSLVGENRSLRVAVLGSHTIDPIKPVLEFESLLDGVPCQILIGGYNQYAQEILDPASALHDFNPDIVVMAVRIEDLIPEFPNTFGDREAAEWRSVIDTATGRLADLASRAVSNLECQVLVQNCVAPQPLALGIYDAQTGAGQMALAAFYNTRLAEQLESVAGAYVWDFASFVSRRGAMPIFDEKMWYLSRNPYAISAYPAIAQDLQRHIRAMQGRVKKCVVLDLDNTLWGGVIGEDGLEGIALGQDYPGNCFRHFQQQLLNLGRRGLILAINSKNNEADAFNAIDNHPDMILRRDAFAAWRINWGDKAANLRQLADELNIGLESMLMLDDSEVECALIEQQLPDFDVYTIPKDPYAIPGFLEKIPGLENINLTSEDRDKARMYRDQIRRRNQEAEYASLDDFLSTLELEVVIREADAFSIPRIAQLTQKTNQFNMTTRRYTESEIASMAEDPGNAIFAISAKDRFGDYGVIGVVIARLDGEVCEIDTFLMSCRVIGRKIENAVIAFVAEFAATRGMKTLRGEFVPTPKNAPAAGVYSSLGLHSEDGSVFEASLESLAVQSPDFIAVTTPDIGQ